MAYNLQQLLGQVTLTGLVNATTDGIPDPLSMFDGAKRNVTGDAGRYTRVTGQRKTARTVKYGAAAVERELKDIATVDVKLMHSFEMQPIQPLVLQALRNYTSYEMQNRGSQEVARQVKHFGTLFKNLRIACKHQVLANGVIYFDGSGNLLPTSSGAVETHSFQMSANNQAQLNGILTTSWDNTSANIPAQLRALKARAAQTTGYPLKIAIYGRNVPTYLTQNDYVLDFLSRNPAWSGKYLDSNAGEIPDGLFGFKWVPAYEAFFEDQDGTNQTTWPADQVTFTPEVSGEWWEVLEGSYLVPTSIDMKADAAAAIGSMKQVHGMFSYGLCTHNPPGVATYTGDTFIYVLRNPDVIFQADTVF